MWKCNKCGKTFKSNVPGHGTFTEDNGKTHRVLCGGELVEVVD